jgi:hypothetical protein
MSSESGPNLITNGLVLCLDAANPLSYKSGATVWNDLTYNTSGGTLTNGPTFSLANGGSIVFDGVDDYVGCGTGFTTLDLVDKSFSAWIFKTSASQKGIIDKDFELSSNNYGGWGFWIQPNNKLWWWNHSNRDIKDNGPNTITLNSWNHVAVVYNFTTKTASFYVNGVLNSSVTNTNVVEKSSGTAPLIIAGLRNNLAGFNFDGRISNVFAYNRLLSASEVLQNYNSTKSRFGL